MNSEVISSYKGIDILYEDNHLLVVIKPTSMPIQDDESGDLSLLSSCKNYIKEKYNKPGAVFLGMVHRLDRPVSGVVVFARTSKAAARLSEQFRQHSTVKKYIAICHGKIDSKGTMIDFLVRNERNSRVTKNKSEGKRSELSFCKIKDLAHNKSLVEIELKTGRHHQIRVQFSHRGFPLVGDFRYGSKEQFPKKGIALHSYLLEITHPTLKKRLTFTNRPNFFYN